MLGSILGSPYLGNYHVLLIQVWVLTQFGFLSQLLLPYHHWSCIDTHDKQISAASTTSAIVNPPLQFAGAFGRQWIGYMLICKIFDD